MGFFDIFKRDDEITQGEPFMSEAEKANLAAQTAAINKQTEILDLSLADFQATKPTLLARSGFKVSEGPGGNTLVPLSREEFLGSLGPVERERTQRLLSAFDRDAAGDPKSFLTEADKQARKEEFTILKENLQGRGINVIGDDPDTAFSTSTAGNQALQKFNLNTGLLAENRTLLALGDVDPALESIRRGSGFLADIPQAQASLGQGFSSVVQGLQGQAGFLSGIAERDLAVQQANVREGLLPQVGRIAGGALSGFLVGGPKGAALGALGSSNLIPFLKP